MEENKPLPQKNRQIHSDMDFTCRGANLTFQETTPRRLVYQLSTTYLLSCAVQAAIKIGLFQRIFTQPIALEKIYAHCQTYSPPHLNRLIRFLSHHQLFQYDEANKTVALDTLGHALVQWVENPQPEHLPFPEENLHILHQDTSFSLHGTPIDLVMTLLHMKQFTLVLHEFSKWELFDAIDEGKNTWEKLIANFAHISTEILNFNHLQLLTHYQFLTRNSQGVYQLTGLGQYLKTTHLDTLQPTLTMLDNAWWKAISQFVDNFRDNAPPAFEIANQQPFFHYLATHPDVQTQFNIGLSVLTKHQDASVVNALQQTPYDLGQYGHLIDIAGGTGGLLKNIQNRYPNQPTLTLYEQASVIADIQLRHPEETQRWQLVTGNFFAPWGQNNIPTPDPQQKTLYCIKGVLHDFSDAECITILSHVRQAMADSTLYVIERTLPQKKQPHINHYGDLMMMMLLTGRERYACEWLRLFVLSGLQWVNETVSIAAEDHSVMVCRPQPIEIPRGIRFFKPHPTKKQTEICSIQSFIHLLKQMDDSAKHTMQADGIDVDVIANNLQFHPRHYGVSYLNLLMRTIQPHTDQFVMLPAISHLQLIQFTLDKTQITQPCYYFLPLYRPIEPDRHHYEWGSLVIDTGHNRLFYLELADPCIAKMLKTRPQFLQMGDTPPLLLSLDSVGKQQQTAEVNESGINVITCLVEFIQKIQLGDLSNPNTPDIQAVCYTSQVFYPAAQAMDEVCQQHLRWAMDYLIESTSLKTEQLPKIFSL